MTNKILIAFAMKQEFVPWRRRHRWRKFSIARHTAGITTIGGTEVCATLAGAGALDAPRLSDLLAQFQPTAAIVTGVAAGLRPEWRSGDVLAAQTVCAPDGKTRLAGAAHLVDLAVHCGARRAETLVTLPRIARTATAKEALANIGDAADMESLPLMQQWSARGIPALALRVILDPVEMPLTCDFEEAMDTHGQVRIAKILVQVARHPRLLPDFLRLARQSRRVMRVLAGFLDRLIETQDRQSPLTLLH